MTNKTEIQLHHYQARNLSIMRDPSLSRCIGTGCAYAQDDSHAIGGGREKKAAKPPSFPFSLPCSGLSS